MFSLEAKSCKWSNAPGADRRQPAPYLLEKLPWSFAWCCEMLFTIVRGRGDKLSCALWTRSSNSSFFCLSSSDSSWRTAQHPNTELQQVLCEMPHLTNIRRRWYNWNPISLIKQILINSLPLVSLLRSSSLHLSLPCMLRLTLFQLLNESVNLRMAHSIKEVAQFLIVLSFLSEV